MVREQATTLNIDRQQIRGSSTPGRDAFLSAGKAQLAPAAQPVPSG